MRLDHCWALSARWYEGRLDLDSQRPAGAHYQALLAGAGLAGEAWSLTPPSAAPAARS
jgi:hypothetical protein